MYSVSLYCSGYCLCVTVYSTVLLPPGVNPTAVNKKYINIYIISDPRSYIHVTHSGMLKTSKEDCCQWRIMAALMQPFKFWASADRI